MSCSKNPQKEILGKWEIVGMYADGVEIDVAFWPIIYEFKDNNIVVISDNRVFLSLCRRPI